MRCTPNRPRSSTRSSRPRSGSSARYPESRHAIRTKRNQDRRARDDPDAPRCAQLGRAPLPTTGGPKLKRHTSSPRWCSRPSRRKRSTPDQMTGPTGHRAGLRPAWRPARCTRPTPHHRLLPRRAFRPHRLHRVLRPHELRLHGTCHSPRRSHHHHGPRPPPRAPHHL